MFRCSRCGKFGDAARFECPKCRDDFCWGCMNESVGRCLKCGIELSPFRPPVLHPSMEFVPTSD